MGRGEEGSSSNRPEVGAACLALEDAKRDKDKKPIILLSDSACLLSSIQKWIGEGKSPSMWGNPDADIMRIIIQLLRERIDLGLLTIFIKIKAHRGDPLNELADRWADKGRESETIRWSLPTNRPIFSWTEKGIKHQSPMNPTVKKRIDIQVAEREIAKHTGKTANFLKREDCSRDLLGKFHKNKAVWIRARRRVLQCVSFQFPCALQLKMWGILKEVKCRLCEKHYRSKNQTAPESVESVGHIQCYCPALERPRIAIHHGIWRELMFSIRKSSTELNEKKEPKWYFPSALSPEAHDEWGITKILEFLGLYEALPLGQGTNRDKLKKDVRDYHTAHGIDISDSEIHTFLARRPDGLAFDRENKLCVFLEFTRAMDTDEDWATRKEDEKNDRYGTHIGFLNFLCRREGNGWKVSQTNFTVGVRGSLHTNLFLDRLETLGVKNKNTREVIRKQTVQKTLSMSDMILKFFFAAIHTNIDWALQTLPTEITNKSMEQYRVYIQPTNPPGERCSHP